MIWAGDEVFGLNSDLGGFLCVMCRLKVVEKSSFYCCPCMKSLSLFQGMTVILEWYVWPLPVVLCGCQSRSLYLISLGAEFCTVPAMSFNSSSSLSLSSSPWACGFLSSKALNLGSSSMCVVFSRSSESEVADRGRSWPCRSLRRCLCNRWECSKPWSWNYMEDKL